MQRSPQKLPQRHEADGTEAEENRRLTNLLLANAIVQKAEPTQATHDQPVAPRKSSVLGYVVLVALIPFYWTHQLLTRDVVDEYEIY